MLESPVGEATRGRTRVSAAYQPSWHRLGLGLRFEGFGFRVLGPGLGDSGLGLTALFILSGFELGTMGFGFDYGLGLRVSSAKWILVVCASEPCAFRSNGTKAPPIEASGPD